MGASCWRSWPGYREDALSRDELLMGGSGSTASSAAVCTCRPIRRRRPSNRPLSRTSASGILSGTQAIKRGHCGQEKTREYRGLACGANGVRSPAISLRPKERHIAENLRIAIGVLFLCCMTAAGCGIPVYRRRRSSQRHTQRQCDHPREPGRRKPGSKISLTNDLIYEFTRSGKVSVTDTEKADAVLSGVIRSMQEFTISHSGGEHRLCAARDDRRGSEADRSAGGKSCGLSETFRPTRAMTWPAGKLESRSEQIGGHRDICLNGLQNGRSTT